MPAIICSIPNSSYESVLLNQRLNTGSHEQAEAGILFGFVGDEFQKVRLGDHHDVRELLLHSSKVGDCDGAVGRCNSGRVKFAVSQLQ